MELACSRRARSSGYSRVTSDSTIRTSETGRVKNMVQSFSRADHRGQEVALGQRPQDAAQHHRRDREPELLEQVADRAERHDGPQVVDVVARRQRADEAEHHHEGRYGSLLEVEHLHQRLDGEIADQSHADQRGEHGREDGVDQLGLVEEHLGARLHALEHERRQHDGGGARARNAHGEQRDHGARRPRRWLRPAERRCPRGCRVPICLRRRPYCASMP